MDFPIWAFLAGIVIVLYGMDLMEESMKDFSGDAIKRRLKKVANTPFKSIVSGSALGAILQSSAVTILIIMAFASAGLLALPNAIGAVIGANLGSTVLGILVVYIGFSFNMASLSLAIIAVGGLIFKFFKSNKRKNAGKLLFAFGLLFYGISILKDSVGILTGSMDLSMFAQVPLIGWFFIGIIFTAILQSSGAMTIITLGALHGGLLSFPQSMAIIAGANIGTCITPFIAAIKGAQEKKQVAWSHIVYNVFASVLVMIFIVPLSDLMQNIYNFSNPGAQETALAMYQTFYNIAATILFFPLIKPLARFLDKVIPDKKLDYVLGIEKLGLTEVDISIPVIKTDVIMLLKKIFKFNVRHLRIDQKKLLNKTASMSEKVEKEFVISQYEFTEDYATCKVIEEDILTFILKTMRQPNISQQVMFDLQALHYAVDRMMYSAKAWKDSYRASYILFESDNNFIENRLQQLKKNMIGLYTLISQIIDKDNIEKNYMVAEDLTEVIKDDNQKFLAEISHYIEKNELEEGLLSELFHLSQAYERSNDAIVDAIEVLYLKKRNGK